MYVGLNANNIQNAVYLCFIRHKNGKTTNYKMNCTYINQV